MTVTPRQRIVLRREMSRQPEWSKLLTQLQHEYEYDGIETCAIDGTCADVCPIGILPSETKSCCWRAPSKGLSRPATLEIVLRWMNG